MFKGEEIILLEINFKNLIGFIESMIRNFSKGDQDLMLLEALDLLYAYFNKLSFYDFKLKTPVDSGLFKEEDFLQLLMISDNWDLNIKYLAVFSRILNYNGWKTDVFDFQKQKRLFVFANSFLNSKLSSRTTILRLIQHQRETKIDDFEELKGHTLKFYKNEEEKKVDFSEFQNEIEKAKENHSSYEIASRIANNHNLTEKDHILEFTELLLATKLRKTPSFHSLIGFMLCAAFFSYLLFDLDYKHFLTHFSLKSALESVLKDIEKNQILLYILVLSQSESPELLENGLILLNELKKPEFYQENDELGLSIEGKLIAAFCENAKRNPENPKKRKVLLRIGLIIRNYFKSKRLKSLKFETIKQMASLMDSLDSIVLDLLKSDFPLKSPVEHLSDRLMLLEDYSAYFLTVQSEKLSPSIEILRFKESENLIKSDYIGYVMLECVIFSSIYLRKILEEPKVFSKESGFLLDSLILAPIRHFGTKKRLFLLKTFILEEGFSGLIKVYERNIHQVNSIAKHYIHTLINNLLYFSLSQEPEVKDLIFEHKKEAISIQKWFRLFCDEKMVVFLCNFNLMKIFIDSVVKQPGPIPENSDIAGFCEVYAEIVLKDLILWGSSGLKLLEDIPLVRLLKQVFLRKFHEILNEITFMVDSDMKQVELLFEYKDTRKNLCESLGVFFQYLGYKYQKTLINVNFVLNTLFSEVYFGARIQQKLYEDYMKVIFKLAVPFQGGIPKEALNMLEHHIIEETGKSPILFIINNLKSALLQSRGFIQNFRSFFKTFNQPIFYKMYSPFADRLFQPVIQGKVPMNFEGFKLLRTATLIEANLGLLKWMLQKYNKVDYYKENHEEVLENLKIIYEEILDWYSHFLDVISEEYTSRLQACWLDFSSLQSDEENVSHEKIRLFKLLKNHVLNLSSITKALSEKNRLFRYITNISKRILKFVNVVRDINEKATQIGVNGLKTKLSILKSKFEGKELKTDGEISFYEILPSLFWLDEINRVVKHSQSFQKGELPWLIFDDGFLRKLTSFFNNAIITYLRANPLINMETFEPIENRESNILLETQLQFKFFLSFFKEIASKFLISRPYDELFHSQNREKYHEESDFTEKLENVVCLNKALLCFWKLVNRWNEDIPDAMTNLYEGFFRAKEKEFRSWGLFKRLFRKLGFAFLDIFLSSAYDNHIRIRSCYSFSIIHHLILNEVGDQRETYISEKKKFASFFIELLTEHFVSIWKGWSLESCPVLFTLSNNSAKINEIKYVSDPNKLDYMTNCCTHAMILNLVSRLIQETNAHDPKIEVGIFMMFGEWRAILGYNRFVAEIFEKMKVRRLIDDEIKTLDNDTIENGITLLKEATVSSKIDYLQLKALIKSFSFSQIFH